jgi:hypothetical protein
MKFVIAKETGVNAFAGRRFFDEIQKGNWPTGADQVRRRTTDRLP